MKILITGIHGFVGSNLVNALSSHHTIYGLDIVAPVKKGVVQTFSWNDLDNENLPDVDIIIHLAGKAHDTKNQSQASIYFKINTELTKKIYDYFIDKPIKKFVFFSSVKAAADTVSGDILTENVVPSPIGPYGKSKIAAEQYILSRKGECIDKNKNFYILRPCMIHGPGNKGNLNLLFNIVNMGIPWPLGAFDNRRTFTSIDNLCFVIKGLLDKDIESGIYNIGDDESLSTNELVVTICAAMGRKAHIWYISCGFMEWTAKMGTFLHLPLNSERLRKLTENYVVSNEKIKKALGVEHLPVKAKEGLTKTIQSFKIQVNAYVRHEI